MKKLAVDVFNLLFACATSFLWIPQGLVLKSKALRLPESRGERRFLSGQSTCNANSAIKLLVIGDSVAAGVGCETVDTSLAGHLSTSLSSIANACVETKVLAKSGDMVADTLNLIEDNDFLADVIVISIGVNDAKGFTSSITWRERVRKLISQLKCQSNHTKILIMPIPQLDQFPLIRWPLSTVLGARSTKLNQIMPTIVSGLDDVYYYSGDFVTLPEHFAQDRFHPNSEACKEIAEKICSELHKIMY